MYSEHRIAVVIPAYREERLLARTVAGVPSWVDLVVVVDDASPDGTWAVARTAAAGDDRVSPVRLGFNRGVGGAIAAGYRRARRLGADIAVVMAGDDQMDPADLPRLIEPIATGTADYVKGNRLEHPEAGSMQLVRRAGTRVLAHLTAIVAGLGELDDSQCGYTALRLSVLDAVSLSEVYPRYGYPNDLLIRLALAGATIEEVPVRPVYGDEVSGFKPHHVVVPITSILLRGAARRAGILHHE